MSGDGLTPELLLVIMLGAISAGGVALLVYAMIPKEPSTVADAPSSVLDSVQALGRRVPVAVAVGLLVLLVTRWVIAAVALGVLILIWDRMFGGGREARQSVARIDAMAAWTESLRDTIAGAVGLEQAIPATTHAAAPAIRDELQALSDRLRVRVPLPEALQRFADELDDSGADLIIAALILNSRLRGPGLREVLSSLADSARAELDMRQRVNAGRRSTERSVQIVIGVSVLFVVLLALFNPEYVEPYDSPVGQMVLAVVLGFFAAGIVWLRRLATFEVPARFLRSRSTGVRV